MGETSDRLYYGVDQQPITNPTKIKIIEVSIDLFSLRGYSGASIRDITKLVGIKESSLYKHFKNKDEILETIFLNFRTETDKLLPPMEYADRIVESMSLAAFLERGMENFLKHIDDGITQKIWRMMYIELFRHPMAQDIYQNHIMKRTVDCLAIIFEKMVQKGKMASLDPRTMAIEYQYCSISWILEYTMMKTDGHNTDELERRIREHVKFFADLARTESPQEREA